MSLARVTSRPGRTTARARAAAGAYATPTGLELPGLALLAEGRVVER